MNEPVDLERLQARADLHHGRTYIQIYLRELDAILAELTEGRKARIAGMEEAAKICDTMGNSKSWEAGCARAIRAAIAADQEGK